METLAITASKWILLLSSSPVLITISDFVLLITNLDGAEAHLVEKKNGKLWMTE